MLFSGLREGHNFSGVRCGPQFQPLYFLQFGAHPWEVNAEGGCGGKGARSQEVPGEQGVPEGAQGTRNSPRVTPDIAVGKHSLGRVTLLVRRFRGIFCVCDSDTGHGGHGRAKPSFSRTLHGAPVFFCWYLLLPPGVPFSAYSEDATGRRWGRAGSREAPVWGPGDRCPVHLPQLPSPWGASAPAQCCSSPPPLIWCAATHLPPRHLGASTEVGLLLEGEHK